MTEPETSDLSPNDLQFEEHCLPHLQELTNYARRLARGDVQRAHDVVQDSIIRAMRGWSHFVLDPSANVKRAVLGWLYRIVHNTFMSAHKASKCRAEHNAKLIVENRVDGVNDLVDEVELAGEDPRDADEGAGEEVLDAVASLTPAYRQAIEMYYFEGRAIDEIAVELGIPRNTVFTRLHRARKSLKKSLSKYAIQNRLALPPPMLEDALQVEGEALEAPEELEADARRVDCVVTGHDRGELLVA